MKRPQIIGIFAATLAVVTYLIYGRMVGDDRSCEGLFARTSDRLAVRLEAIKAKGEGVVSDDTFRDLTERTQALAMNLRTCCTVLEGGRLDPESFLRCKAGAQNFDYRMGRVVAAVGATNAPRDGNGGTQQEVDSALRSADDSAEDLALQLQQLVLPGTSSTPPSDNPREHEPNDGFATATPLALNTHVTGTLSGAVDRDFFSVRSEGGARDRARVRLRNRSQTLAPQIFVFDGRKARLAEHYDVAAGTDLDFTFTVEPHEDHYVEVFRFGRSGGDYDLSVALERAFDEYEPNDDPLKATAIQPGQLLAANILDERDADWYRLKNPDGGHLRARLENRSLTLQPEVRVYDSNRAQIADGHTLTAGASLDLALPDATSGSDCYLVVTRFAGRGGSYALGVDAPAD